MGSRHPLEEGAERRLLRRVEESLKADPLAESGKEKNDSEPAFYGDDFFIITEGNFRGRHGKYRSNPDGTRAQVKR